MKTRVIFIWLPAYLVICMVALLEGIKNIGGA